MKYIDMTNTNMIFIIFMMSGENESLGWKNKKLMKIRLCEITILMNPLRSKIKKMREIRIDYHDENYLSI